VVAALGGVAWRAAHTRPLAPVALAPAPTTAAPAGPATPLAPGAPALGTGAVAATPTLTVAVDVAAARITLDGRVVAAAAHRLRVPVDRPGEHQLEIAAPRRKLYTRTIVVPASGDLALAIKLERATPATPVANAKARPRGDDYLVDPFGKHK
jgi:hypothetical protein